MAKFALFSSSLEMPLHEIEGDYMTQDGPIVKVFKNAGMSVTQVGAIQLDKGQLVKEVGSKER